MARRLLLMLFLAALPGSCAPPNVRAQAVFIGGSLAFVEEEGGDPHGCWEEAAVIDESGRPAWRFSAEGTGECGPLFPLFYGRAPRGIAGLREAAPAKLQPGHSTSWSATPPDP